MTDYHRLQIAARAIIGTARGQAVFDADDLAQETALRQLSGRKSIDGPMRDLVRRDGRIGGTKRARLCYSVPIYEAAQLRAPEENKEHELVRIAAEREKEGRVRQAVRRLHPSRQRVIQAYFFEALPLKQVGRALGFNESRACQLKNSALAQLRSILASLLLVYIIAIPLAAQSTIWPTIVAPSIVDAGAGAAVELGLKFRSDIGGTITGIRFYKSAANTGPHVGNLWSNTGALLATAMFTNETASGWQQANFAAPVPITAGTVYVASYHTNVSHFSFDPDFFESAHANPPLWPVGSAYTYSSASAFPASNYRNSNYWVDVVFSAVAPAPTSLIWIGNGAAIVSAPCPPGWSGARQNDGTCLAVKP